MRRRADAPSEVLINLRVTPEERERIRMAARANYQSLSEFARDAIADAASETLEEDTDPGEAQTEP